MRKQFNSWKMRRSTLSVALLVSVLGLPLTAGADSLEVGADGAPGIDGTNGGDGGDGRNGESVPAECMLVDPIDSVAEATGIGGNGGRGGGGSPPPGGSPGDGGHGGSSGNGSALAEISTSQGPATARAFSTGGAGGRYGDPPMGATSGVGGAGGDGIASASAITWNPTKQRDARSNARR